MSVARSRTTSRVTPSVAITSTREITYGTSTMRNTSRALGPDHRPSHAAAPRSSLLRRRELLETGLLEVVVVRRHDLRHRARARELVRQRFARTVVVRVSRSGDEPDRVVAGAPVHLRRERRRIGRVQPLLVVDPVDERRRREGGIRDLVEAGPAGAGAPPVRADPGSTRPGRPAAPTRRNARATCPACVRCSMVPRKPPTSPSTTMSATAPNRTRPSTSIDEAAADEQREEREHDRAVPRCERLAGEVVEAHADRRAWRRR